MAFGRLISSATTYMYISWLTFLPKLCALSNHCFNAIKFTYSDCALMFRRTADVNLFQLSMHCMGGVGSKNFLIELWCSSGKTHYVGQNNATAASLLSRECLSTKRIMHVTIVMSTPYLPYDPCTYILRLTSSFDKMQNVIM